MNCHNPQGQIDTINTRDKDVGVSRIYAWGFLGQRAVLIVNVRARRRKDHSLRVRVRKETRKRRTFDA